MQRSDRSSSPRRSSYRSMSPNSQVSISSMPSRDYTSRRSHSPHRRSLSPSSSVSSIPPSRTYIPRRSSPRPPPRPRPRPHPLSIAGSTRGTALHVDSDDEGMKSEHDQAFPSSIPERFANVDEIFSMAGYRFPVQYNQWKAALSKDFLIQKGDMLVVRGNDIPTVAQHLWAALKQISHGQPVTSTSGLDNSLELGLRIDLLANEEHLRLFNV